MVAIMRKTREDIKKFYKIVHIISRSTKNPTVRNTRNKNIVNQLYNYRKHLNPKEGPGRTFLIKIGLKSLTQSPILSIMKFITHLN